MVSTEEKKKIGKKSRQQGLAFERKVREDLEKKGFICDKWSNNVDIIVNKLIPAKHKFRGKGIPMAMGTGFPDFSCHIITDDAVEVIGVECKSNGYLKPEEKQKCKWLLENKVFSKILIASKTKEGRKIVVKYKKYIEDGV